MGLNLNTVGQTAHGAGKGIHMAANYEAWNPTHNRAVHEMIHPIRAYHATRDGVAVWGGTSAGDYGLKSYAPGVLIDLKKLRKVGRKLEKRPGVKHVVNKVKDFTDTKKFKHSDLGMRWHHLEKTGKVHDPAAARKHREEEHEGKHGVQALAGTKINHAYLKARRQQKEDAIAGPHADKSKNAIEGPEAE